MEAIEPGVSGGGGMYVGVSTPSVIKVVKFSEKCEQMEQVNRIDHELSYTLFMVNKQNIAQEKTHLACYPSRYSYLTGVAAGQRTPARRSNVRCPWDSLAEAAAIQVTAHSTLDDPSGYCCSHPPGWQWWPSQ